MALGRGAKVGASVKLTLNKVNFRDRSGGRHGPARPGRGRVDRGTDGVEVPEARGLRRLGLEMIEGAVPGEAGPGPRRIRGRARRAGRGVVRDVVRARGRDLRRLLHATP